MAKYNVVGYSVADFVSKAGKPIKGYWLQCTRSDQRTTGLKVESILVPDVNLVPKIGEADINFNRSGYVDSVVFAK